MTTRTTSSRWLQLAAGIAALGAGIGLLIAAGYGTGSWQVLDTGTAATLDITAGQANIAVSLAALAIGAALGQRPRLATLAVTAGVGPTVDATLAAVAGPLTTPASVAAFTAGTALAGVGIAAMVAADIGLGPIDAVWVGLKARTGWSVTRTRLTIDAVVLAAGAALGGAFGLGTIIHTIAIAPVVAIVLRALTADETAPAVVPGALAPTVAAAATRQGGP